LDTINEALNDQNQLRNFLLGHIQRIGVAMNQNAQNTQTINRDLLQSIYPKLMELCAGVHATNISQQIPQAQTESFVDL